MCDCLALVYDVLMCVYDCLMRLYPCHMLLYDVSVCANPCLMLEYGSVLCFLNIMCARTIVFRVYDSLLIDYDLFM